MPVVDASVAVKLVVEEEGSEQAVLLLGSAEPLIAPDWLLVEVGHALWKKVRTDAITAEDAANGLSAMRDFFQELPPATTLLDQAYELAFQLDHWLYDCLYLALALKERVPLVTADREFRKAAARGGYGATVLLVGD